MLNVRIARALLTVGALLAVPFASIAQSGESAEVEAFLVKKYTNFAGSEQNAQSLVSGLRNGTPITLQPAGAGCAPAPGPGPFPPPPGAFPPPPGFPPPPAGTPATFTPPTGNMGYGNANVAIGLAQQQLAKAGIAKPNPVQIQASFMGGPVSTCSGVSTQLAGVLVMRAGKEGWGRIALKLGLNVNDTF